MKGLVVNDKAPRIKNYQEATIHSFLELVAAAGLITHQNLEENISANALGCTR
ncbi:hypothetical protein Q2T40_00950 [Winogradskyella maritima]|nr:hypothetical protein [Winogradskyella maritima]